MVPLVYFFLPDSPQTARFLSPRQREIAQARLARGPVEILDGAQRVKGDEEAALAEGERADDEKAGAGAGAGARGRTRIAKCMNWKQAAAAREFPSFPRSVLGLCQARLLTAKPSP